MTRALQTVSAANGITTRVAYSPLGLPEAVHLTHPGGEALADIALRFALNDALCEADDSGLGHARFEYDPAGNLTYSRTPSGQDDYEQNSAANAMKARWAAQGRGRHSGPGQPALATASGGGKGPTSRPIGKPGPMKMAAQGPGHTPVPTGRVAAPGGRVADYKTYDTNAKVPAHYSSDPRFQSLATDPAHGSKPPLPSGRQEAMAGLEAEHQGLVPGPISRGPAEIEFYDGKGNPWDVKTPPSPLPGAPWSFDAQKVAASIQEELSLKGSPLGTYPNGISGLPEPRQIILDSSYMNPADHAALWKELNSTLNQNEMQRIVEVNTH